MKINAVAVLVKRENSTSNDSLGLYA